MRRWLLITMMVVVCAAPRALHAMSIQRNVRPVAWAKDGLTLLLREDQHGPEGGGSLAYWALGIDGSIERFLLSSDFSPGGSEQPQTVSAAACKQAVAKLLKRAPSKQFPRLKISAAACKKKSREGVVIVPDTLHKRVTDSQLISSGKFRWARGNAAVAIDAKTELRISEAGVTVPPITLAKPGSDGLSIYLEAGRHMLIALDEDDGIVAFLLTSATGKLDALALTPVR